MMHQTVRPPRVALASVGLGRIQRGFERYFSDLHAALRDEIDVTLYKSAGPRENGQRVPPLFRGVSLATAMLPLGTVGAEYRTYKNDCLAFALTLLPELLRNDYDVLHVIDYPLERALDVLYRIFRFRTKLLFTNGMGMPPQFYPRIAHVHHVAKSFYDIGIEGGIPPSRMTFVPCGIETQRYRTALTRQQLRKKHGIPEDLFVVLVVSALKSVHKRVDHIIQEANRLNGEFLLWLDGRPEEEAVVRMAKEKLGPRCRVTYVPSSDVQELYGLADVMVHGALAETFGLSVAEALSAGTPVLAHDSPHFEWLIGDRENLVDMTAEGVLAARLEHVRARRDDYLRRAQARSVTVRERFDWESVTPAYVDMYREIAAVH